MKLKSLLASAAACAIAVSAMAISASAVPIANSNDPNSDNYVVAVGDNLPAGCKISDVYGAEVKISGVKEESGAGGGIVFQSDSAGWSQKEWGNEGSEKPCIYNYTDLTFTRLETEAPFAESDEWANIVIMQWDNWGEGVTVDSVKLLGADGKELAAKEAETTTTTTEAAGGETTTTTTTEKAADATTTKAAATTTKAAAATTKAGATTTKAAATKAGDAGVGMAVAGLAAASAAALIFARKKH